MERFRIAFLTSSRADYSIYLPLLRAIREEEGFVPDIIAFGTHTSEQYGYTVQYIENDGFHVTHKLETLVPGDSPESIAMSMGLTTTRFSALWAATNYNLVFTLGDRYEMFAAAASLIPFNVPVAHIAGGETTLGAIDNVFRHSLTLMSALHFTSAEAYRNKVVSLLGSDEGVYNVGSLSIDNLKTLPLYSLEEFEEKWGIDLGKPTILITFHPETVSFEKNEDFITELIAALDRCKEYQLVITMPNADTSGNMIRRYLNRFIEEHTNAVGVESFGTLGYLSCMKHCRFLLGNTSSGFVDASFFPKHVINLGNRQQGRILTPNIVNCELQREAILEAIEKVGKAPIPVMKDFYGDGTAAKQIVGVLKEYRNNLRKVKE